MSKRDGSDAADLYEADITRQAELVVMEYLKANKCSKTLDAMLSGASSPASVAASDLYTEDLHAKKTSGAATVLDFIVHQSAREQPLDSTLSSHKRAGSRRGPESSTASDDKAAVEWSKEEVRLLKRAIKETSAIDDKNDRWKQIASLVGSGKSKKHCYLKYKELKEEKKASSSADASSSRSRSSSSDEKSSSRRSSRSKSTERGDSKTTTNEPDKHSEELVDESKATEPVMMKRVEFKVPEERRSTHRQEVIEMEDCEDFDTTVVPVSRPSRSSTSTQPGIVATAGRAPTADEIDALQAILFPDGKKGFSSHWEQQGFFFSDVRNLRYGLVQHEGGPCGVLAVVQAYTLRFLLDVIGSKDWRSPTQADQERALVQAMTHILWQAARASKQNQCTVVLNSDSSSDTASSSSSKRRFMGGTQLYPLKSQQQTEQFLTQHLRQFTAPRGNGLVLFVVSVLLSKGVDNIKPEMDSIEGALGGSSKLIGGHDYCTQEMVNLLLCGVACSNVFDGKQLLEGASEDDPKAVVLKGIPSRCDVGFLSLFEAYEYIRVGSHLKTPVFNVWVVCSESHYSVLFADPAITTVHDSLRTIDMFYYDGLANQDEEIRLTVHTTALREKPKPQLDQLVPPLNLVLQTKWPLARIDWNGVEPLL